MTIIRDNTNADIERHKARLSLTGDVYMIGNFIETLATHKLLIPTSTATTIEEAHAERLAYEEAQAALRALQAEDEEEIE
ncbi:hypothetical protein EOM57_05790 [Candidatus Saccharibacteria bacterium]|nr:hypothetical protein [Candidatus Saccharibacteria bacterium]